MFRYIVTLLLVSFYSKSSGAPTNGSSTDISVILKNLANTCENQYLSAQITSKLSDCHVFVPPYDEKNFQCMLFYDINKQLCAAVAASKLVINEDYTSQIQVEQDVTKLCSVAKEWSFTALGETYNKFVSGVFDNPIKCARVCSAKNDDLMNVESNYYCKYLKWSNELLKTHIVTAPTQSGTAVGAQVQPVANIATKKPVVQTPVVLSSQSSPDVNVKSPIDISKPVPVADTVQSPVSADSAVETSEKVNSANPALVETNPESSVPAQSLNNVAAPTPNPVKPPTNENKPVVDPSSAVSDDGTQNSQVQTEPEKKPDTSSDVNKDSDKPKTSDSKKVGPQNSLPNSQVDKPNDIADPDNYQNELDSDEIRGGLDNQGGDDGDDPTLAEMELKGDNNKLDENKKIESSLTQINVNDISQKEYYPSDGFTDDDDDHFFSFFLTAIIMVALLYILYHNKSKVSKVIMGLIVEGRQPGRRRNSRGHAYKRLDTLEQAMSANSAAPPSKIIY